MKWSWSKTNSLKTYVRNSFCKNVCIINNFGRLRIGRWQFKQPKKVIVASTWMNPNWLTYNDYSSKKLRLFALDSDFWKNNENAFHNGSSSIDSLHRDILNICGKRSQSGGNRQQAEQTTERCLHQRARAMECRRQAAEAGWWPSACDVVPAGEWSYLLYGLNAVECLKYEA